VPFCNSRQFRVQAKTKNRLAPLGTQFHFQQKNEFGTQNL
jgi:hypothetical protein